MTNNFVPEFTEFSENIFLQNVFLNIKRNKLGLIFGNSGVLPI